MGLFLSSLLVKLGAKMLEERSKASLERYVRIGAIIVCALLSVTFAVLALQQSYIFERIVLWGVVGALICWGIGLIAPEGSILRKVSYGTGSILSLLLIFTVLIPFIWGFIGSLL
jgi:hypothetical protein